MHACAQTHTRQQFFKKSSMTTAESFLTPKHRKIVDMVCPAPS
jgi:hypothetical protein